MSLFGELKRRNVFRVAVAYLVAAWLALQVSQLVLEAIEAPSWVIKVFLLVAAIGFPIVLLFSWAYELTPEGIKKEKDVDRSQSVTSETGKKLDQLTIGMVVLLLAFLVFDRLVPEDGVQEAPESEIAETLVLDKSIAVLAFEDMSAEGDQEYFADGLSEELLNVLAQVPGFEVAGRTSSFAFKGQNRDLREIGEILNVAHILEGSVRKAGNRIRVTAQLINADSGYHLYSETFDRDLRDIFALQDELASAISDALQAELGGEEIKPVLETSIEAYDLFLIARQKVYSRDRFEMEEASRMLDQALEIDPDYVPAMVEKALVVYLLSDVLGAYGEIPIAEATAYSRPLITRALQLDPNYAEAHAVSALLRQGEPGRNRVDGIPELERALALNPGSANGQNWLASAYNVAGRMDDAIRIREAQVEHDPMYAPSFNNLVQVYSFTRRFDDAEALIDRVDRITQGRGVNGLARGTVLNAQGRFAEAIRVFREAAETDSPSSVMQVTYGFALLSIGEYEEVLEIGIPAQAIAANVELGRMDEARQLVDNIDMNSAQNINLDMAAEYFLRSDNCDEVPAYIEKHFGSLESLMRDRTGQSGTGSIFTSLFAECYRRIGDSETADELGDAAAEMVATRKGLGMDDGQVNAGAILVAALHGNAEEVIAAVKHSNDNKRGQYGIFETPIMASFIDLPAMQAERARSMSHVNGERAKLGLDPLPSRIH